MAGVSPLLIPVTLLAALALPNHAQELIIEDDSEEELVIEDDAEQGLVIEDDGDEALVIGDDEESDLEDTVSNYDEYEDSEEEETGLRLNLEQLRAEYGHFLDSDTARYQLYGQARFSLEWQNETWELKIGGRLDSFHEQPEEGQLDGWHDTELDYDETYIRYKSGDGILTLGAQKIIWGRIDEFPPTDKLSTQDLRRGALDELDERRLASLAVRYEHFFDVGKLDLVYYPRFREAQLAGTDSVWHSVNRRQGTIFGLDTPAMVEQVVRQADIREKAPDTEGGIGIRFNRLGDQVDYALTLQRGINTLPYFAYNPSTNTLEGRYPRTTVVAADMGFEALGGTLKLEAAWNSDTPVTRNDGRFDTVASVAWGVALELFPGDGDARLNLQLVGNRLQDADDVLDRDNSSAFNGSFEAPFGEDNWRVKFRFNIGLDKKDLYLNPELAYIGWSDQEVYLAGHGFDGDKATAGGFYEDNSLLNLGWRANF